MTYTIPERRGSDRSILTVCVISGTHLTRLRVKEGEERLSRGIAKGLRLHVSVYYFPATHTRTDTRTRTQFTRHQSQSPEDWKQRAALIEVVKVNSLGPVSWTRRRQRPHDLTRRRKKCSEKNDSTEVGKLRIAERKTNTHTNIPARAHTLPSPPNFSATNKTAIPPPAKRALHVTQ